MPRLVKVTTPATAVAVVVPVSCGAGGSGARDDGDGDDRGVVGGVGTAVGPQVDDRLRGEGRDLHRPQAA